MSQKNEMRMVNEADVASEKSGGSKRIRSGKRAEPQLRALTLNVRSARRADKRAELGKFLETQKAQIVVLTETWLNFMVNQIGEFAVHQSPPSEHQGVAILTGPGVQNVTPVLPSAWTSTLVAVSVQCGLSQAYVVASYAPPHKQKDAQDELLAFLAHLHVRARNPAILAMGDWNIGVDEACQLAAKGKLQLAQPDAAPLQTHCRGN